MEDTYNGQKRKKERSLDIPHIGKDRGETRALNTLGWKLLQLFWKAVWEYTIKYCLKDQLLLTQYRRKSILSL